MSTIIKLLLFIKFAHKALKKYLRYGSKDFRFSGIQGATVHVLGNGPSLKQSLVKIGDKDDVIMVNFSVLTDLFTNLKPNYLCLADPDFFIFSNNVDLESKKKLLIERLRNVDWNLVIVVPASIEIDWGEMVSECVSVQRVNTVPFDQSVQFSRNFCYKYNFSIPPIQNVLVMAIYVAIQRGYESIYLHGADSDGFKNIQINQNNQMVLNESHYYGVAKRNLSTEEGSMFKTGELYKRLAWESNMFRSYLDLSIYASYTGSNIFNLSARSMIDVFDRNLAVNGKASNV